VGWDVFLGYFTGLRFIADLEPATVLRTALVVNACNAALCRVFANKNGLNENKWMAFGFVFGPWAIATVAIRLLLSRQTS
jgi:hypothetical protein